jgi:energy-coupling factor transport system ATP-binding protein
MEIFSLRQLSFRYPECSKAALDQIDLNIKQGEFLLLCGLSGSGKSTLLRLLKPQMAPAGSLQGELRYRGRALADLSPARQAREVGYVGQSPENSLVTDKVWHELAFALESLGERPEKIRLRVAEMANYFGIQHWFHKSVNELAGGQKQILNLAAVMTTDPSVILLDEPTSQLDPVAAVEFMDMVGRVNQDLGVTVVLADHRLDEPAALADRIAVLHEGRCVMAKEAADAIQKLAVVEHPMLAAAPAAARLWACMQKLETDVAKRPMAKDVSQPAITDASRPPITVGEGRRWITEYLAACQAASLQTNEEGSGTAPPRADERVSEAAPPRADERVSEAAPPRADADDETGETVSAQADDVSSMRAARNRDIAALRFDELWFAYEKNKPTVLKDLSFELRSGEIVSLMGGNASGKSTLLQLAAGILKPQRGRILIKDQDLTGLSDRQRYAKTLAWLPQTPAALFQTNSVRAELAAAAGLPLGLLSVAKEPAVGDELTAESRPATESGPATESESAAESGPATTACEIVIKLGLAELLDRHPFDLSGGEQQKLGLAIVLLKRADILLLDEPTKGIDRQATAVIADLLRAEAKRGAAILIASHDVDFNAAMADRCLLLFDGGIQSEAEPHEFFNGNKFYTTAINRIIRPWFPGVITVEEAAAALLAQDKTGINDAGDGSGPDGNGVGGSGSDVSDAGESGFGGNDAGESGGDGNKTGAPGKGSAETGFSGRDYVGVAGRLRQAAWLLLPLTVVAGYYLFGERRYFLISILLIIEALGLFALRFEKKRPPAREIVLIAVLCGAGVAGRLALYMIPQFKPVTAVAVLSGVTLGAEAGFMVGSLSMFLSNILMGQGPWTPWQMIAMGLIGWLAGKLFYKRHGREQIRRLPVTVFGGLATFLIYGLIMNSATVLITQNQPTPGMFLVFIAQGLPFDLVHAGATVLFLWWLTEPFAAAVQRIRIKYGFSR